MKYKEIVFLKDDSIDKLSDVYLKLKEKKLLTFFSSNTSDFILVDRSVFDSYNSGDIFLFKDSFCKRNLLLEVNEPDEQEFWNRIRKTYQGRYFHKEDLYPHENILFDIKDRTNFFYYCNFTKETSFIHFNKPKVLLKNYFEGCTFNFVDILVNDEEWKSFTPENQIKNQTDLTCRFYRCKFENFHYTTRLSSQYLFIQSNQIQHLNTNSSNIKMRNIELRLFEHKNLTNRCNWEFENVKITFDKSLLQSHRKDSDSKRKSPFYKDNYYNELINTYEYLHKNPGLFSQSRVIKKYLNYFTSHPSLIHRLLFWFNEGYTNWYKPLSFLLITILIKIIILNLNPEIFSNNQISLIPVFYSIELFKNVILNELSFNFNCCKIFLVPFEVIYLFSIFSLTTYIKREYGFGKVLD